MWDTKKASIGHDHKIHISDSMVCPIHTRLTEETTEKDLENRVEYDMDEQGNHLQGIANNRRRLASRME
jgi:hypothetical protein